MKADILREKFLKFFESKGHRIVKSDFLVPKDDPTVLFTPAGMNQFKKEFLGYDSGFKRAVTSQRCLRTDDLDKVGKTRGHHTFFEMLGNFSFGDYFKKEAIAWAWEFLTRELNIPQEKLWVSVYKDDEEAYAIWKDAIKVPVKKIVKLGDKENFWPSEAKEKGPNGPCGPCSEIFFDQGKEAGCGKQQCDPSCDCGRFLEVWNLVFTQFNRKENGGLEPLPNKNIDTGMGLERLAAVMQGVSTNFGTDLFQPIIKEIIAESTKGDSLTREIHAVADHLRAIVFAIYDGVLPANEKQGYVVRKLIRRSILHLRTLGIKKEFLYKLVPVIADIMKEPYPDLTGRRENIAEIVLIEERNFIAVLHASHSLLEEKYEWIGAPGSEPGGIDEKAGIIAFQLYDTHGIPLELTKDYLAARGVSVSDKAFEKELRKQKERSKAQSHMQGDVFSLSTLELGVNESEFLGYETHVCEGEIIKIIKDGVEVQEAVAGDEVSVILNRTVFYPESGGQIGDTGIIENDSAVFEVADTQKSDKVILHLGRVKRGAFKKGNGVTAKVDVSRRRSIARNHTATHLLQAALRKVLGEHVQQQGSFVEDKRLRFDFTHFKNIKDEELSRIEELVNEYVMDNFMVDKREMSIDEAKDSGALAFFSEKYEETVRVVSINDISRELCGGVHLRATGEIGLFKILQESSVGSGVRRIEAVTGRHAYNASKFNDVLIRDLSSSLKTAPDKIMQEFEKKNARARELEKKLKGMKLNFIISQLDTLVEKSLTIGSIRFIVYWKDQEDLDMDVLRKAVDAILDKTGHNNTIAALGSKNDGKALLVIGMTSDLCQKGFDASKLILEPARIIGGSGGGRKDFAQAGGSKPGNFAQAFEKLKESLS